jgi:hypothetical protein
VTRLTVLETTEPAVRELGPSAVIDLPHPDDASRARFSRPGAFHAAALVWTDGSPVAIGGPSFRLHEHVGWLASATDAAAADPAGVVKQVSFLHKSDSVDLDGFRDHYRHHVELARKHMPTLWQYVQYDVLGIDGNGAGPAEGIVAVSVLWFRTTDDFLHHYFASPEDEAAFRAEEGFLDLTKAFSFVMTSHPSTGPAARPATHES